MLRRRRTGFVASSSSPTDADDAGFRRADDRTRAACPLESMDVRGRIDGLLSRVTVRQVFVNAFDEPLEATYIFPLPDRAAVTGFRMEVAGRVDRGRPRGARQGPRALRPGDRPGPARGDRRGRPARRLQPARRQPDARRAGRRSS